MSAPGCGPDTKELGCACAHDTTDGLAKPRSRADVYAPLSQLEDRTMNAAESQLLRDFLNNLTAAGAVEKDAEADSLIAEAVAKQPNATYLLVQRALLLEQALNRAKGQIAQLQGELQATRSPAASSFLDSGSAWGRSGDSAARSIPPPAAAPATAPATARSGFLGGAGGSFLGNVAATAAGVAGGAFLFQGLESLLGHRESGFLGTANAAPEIAENVTVNNYDRDDKSASDEDGTLTDADYADDDFSDDSSWT
jgi:hypothetical protein